MLIFLIFFGGAILCVNTTSTENDDINLSLRKPPIKIHEEWFVQPEEEGPFIIDLYPVIKGGNVGVNTDKNIPVEDIVNISKEKHSKVWSPPVTRKNSSRKKPVIDRKKPVIDESVSMKEDVKDVDLVFDDEKRKSPLKPEKVKVKQLKKRKPYSKASIRNKRVREKINPVSSIKGTCKRKASVVLNLFNSFSERRKEKRNRILGDKKTKQIKNNKTKVQNKKPTRLSAGRDCYNLRNRRGRCRRREVYCDEEPVCSEPIAQTDCYDCDDDIGLTDMVVNKLVEAVDCLLSFSSDVIGCIFCRSDPIEEPCCEPPPPQCDPRPVCPPPPPCAPRRKHPAVGRLRTWNLDLPIDRPYTCSSVRNKLMRCINLMKRRC